jgi:hypothetical protein
MAEFKVGDQVRWKRAIEWKMKDASGRIVALIPNGEAVGVPAYHVQFVFGTIRLSGSQIELDDVDTNNPAVV